MIKNWLSISALFLVLHVQAQVLPDWENPGIFERGQVAPHATLMPFNGEKEALGGKRKSSPNCLMLNGTWDFQWSVNLEQAPRDFYMPGFNREEWDRIRVPSNWQMEGFGHPKFRNIGLPHPLDPPEVPRDFNPVGSYYRDFSLPAGWKDKQVFLHFEGVQSASRVWINGKEVGYNQGGMEPAEYDITPFLREGENNIAVRVLRFCDGSYLEDQDTWRLSGIFRDVYLMATPKQHIRDYYVVTDLDREYMEARLDLQVEVENYRKRAEQGLEIRTRLYGPKGSVVGEGSSRLELPRIPGMGSEKLKLSMDISAPALWSAEYPELYTLVMELRNAEGKVLEFLSQRIGFREVEVKDQAILVNGVAVKFNGVNSHMLHPETGHAMDTETMREDLELMKRFNINCVRTSHYPPNVEYIELANELGIYIVDETGDEAHAYIYLSDSLEWRPQYLDRMRKMVYRDRNQPSVVIWSAGNESGSGDNICAIMSEGKKIDPSRPAWLYGGNRDEDPRTNPIRCEDIVGPRYLHPFMLEQRFAKSDDPRPSFMDEYIAATGNGLGGLDDYWELIRKYPRLTGGAIWDWVSPGITQPVVLTPDESPGNIQCALINRAKLVEGPYGKALYLSGQDDWMVTYRDPSLDITGEALSLGFHVKPGAFNGNGDFLMKGDYQFGIVQRQEDILSFYIYTDSRHVLEARLPENWEGEWHHVAGIYDGHKMELYVDGKIIGTRACSGSIRNAPYWLTLGKSAEMRDSHRGYMCHATMDRVRVFDAVLGIADLEADEKQELLEKSRLWLDFESVENEGTYWTIGIPGRTYGLVWPDRSIQPELWQLKKSPQPVEIAFRDPEGQKAMITNHYHFRNLSELEARWYLNKDGEVLQQGSFDLDLPPGVQEEISIPYEKPQLKGGSVYHLLLSFVTREDMEWASAGHEVAWEQFELPWQSPSIVIAEGLQAPLAEERNDTLFIEGEGFGYAFVKARGGLCSIRVDGREMLKQGPGLNVWRAPLANDLDAWNKWHTEMGGTQEWMGVETANGWRSAGIDHLVHEVDDFSWSLSGDSAVSVLLESSVHANNTLTGYKIHYSYTIEGDGKMSLHTRVSPRGFQPRWIPKLGLQMELVNDFSRMEWLGRGPFENYPDRKTGARTGLYRSSVEDEYPGYIIPQEYGNRCDIHWCSMTDTEGRGLKISGGELFNFSAQAWATDVLDRSHYHFQLGDGDKVILNLDHRVSGVGGTALSVLNQYRVFPGEYEFTFYLSPLKVPLPRIP